MFEHYDAAWNELTAEGSPFAVTEIEVRGHPCRVFENAPPTMRALWELAQGHGDNTYVIYEDERYTYAEIGAQVRSLAHYLRDVHGVGSGDRVAIAMRNYPEWSCSPTGRTLSIGAAAVGMNAWWTAPEMALRARGREAPKVLICDDERSSERSSISTRSRAESPLHGGRGALRRGELPEGVVTGGPEVVGLGHRGSLPDGDDRPRLRRTASSTPRARPGAPKGAQLTHRGCGATT